jgi:hypothetical protein
MSVPSTRRAVLTGLAASALLVRAHPSSAEALPQVQVSKDPTCGCCKGWVDHLRAEGFPVNVTDSREMGRVKVRLGVPQELGSCHTAEVAGYVIEGHVPAGSIKRLLAQKPSGQGARCARHAGGLARYGSRGLGTRHLRGGAVRRRQPFGLRPLPRRA